jgi:hypothetical protein
MDNISSLSFFINEYLKSFISFPSFKQSSKWIQLFIYYHKNKFLQDLNFSSNNHRDMESHIQKCWMSNKLILKMEFPGFPETNGLMGYYQMKLKRIIQKN